MNKTAMLTVTLALVLYFIFLISTLSDRGNDAETAASGTEQPTSQTPNTDRTTPSITETDQVATTIQTTENITDTDEYIAEDTNEEIVTYDDDIEPEYSSTEVKDPYEIETPHDVYNGLIHALNEIPKEQQGQTTWEEAERYVEDNIDKDYLQTIDVHELGRLAAGMEEPDRQRFGRLIMKKLGEFE